MAKRFKLSTRLNYLVISLFLVVLVGLTCQPAPYNSPQDEAEKPFLCVTEEGYEQILKEGYTQGWTDARSKADLCEYDLKVIIPTVAQVHELLAEDDTEEITGGCVCTERAESLNDAALERGLWSYVIWFNSINGYGHVIVAFDTTDSGMIYVEPKYDFIIDAYTGLDPQELVGKDYCNQFINCTEPFVIKQVATFR